MMAIKAIILAGGKGERLWPLSRAKKPKQLLPFTDGKSLLAQTITRLSLLVEPESISIVTNQEQYEQTVAAAGNLVGQVCAEPVVRNTAPAIALMVLKAMQISPHATLVFVPADHLIDQNDQYIAALERASEYAQEKKCITLLGVKPRTPATGYGYIEYEGSADGVARVVAFHEKPDGQTAQRYLENGTMLWNVGVFCAPAFVFFEAFKCYAPALLKAVERFMGGDQDAYAMAESISIDYAILEKAKQLAVVPADFGWSDVGNLETFLSSYVPASKQEIVSINARNNLVASSKKIVALVGVEDLCIVEHDDALLIAKRTEVEQVKKVVAQLKEVAGDTYI